MKTFSSIVFTLVAVYLVLRYWPQIKASGVAAIAAVSPATATASATPGMTEIGSFGAGGVTLPAGSTPLGPSFAGGNVGPGQTDNSSFGNPYVYINTSRDFGNCSTHPWDLKPLCG